MQQTAMNEVKRIEVENSRSLYTGTELQVSWDLQKILEKYDLTTLDFYLPQLLICDGLTKKLEESFTVEVVANARYQKTKPDGVDWSHLGFADQEAFDKWWKEKKAVTSAGTETKFTEDRPFKDREDKFDRENNRNKMPGAEGNEFEFFYLIQLTPIEGPLKNSVRQIAMRLRPADFLPVSINMTFTNDVQLSLQFEKIQTDPEPEIADDRFKLEVPAGTTVKWPQKE
jgi:hypothetical protein